MKKINENAPVICKKSIMILAPKTKIWSVLTDIDNWHKWQSDISTSRLNGTVEVDNTFDWKSGGIKIHSTLHTIEPERHLGWTGKATGVSAIHNWTISEKNGLIEVLVEESMEGFLASIFKKAFNKNLEKGLQTWLDLLKKECERK